MKKKIKDLKEQAKGWEKVKHALYQIWIGHQQGPILPIWLDIEFNRLFVNFKKTHTLSSVIAALNL